MSWFLTNAPETISGLSFFLLPMMAPDFSFFNLSPFLLREAFEWDFLNSLNFVGLREHLILEPMLLSLARMSQI